VSASIPPTATNVPSAPSGLEQALTDLPPKLRVHELAKRAGIGSKEVIAALAAAGVTVASAASSVPNSDARALLTALLTAGDAAPAADPPTEHAALDAASSVQLQQDAGFFAAPVFLPPAEAKPARRRGRKAAVATEPTSDTESVDPADSIAPAASAVPPGQDAGTGAHPVGEAPVDQDESESVGTSRSGRRRRGRSGTRGRTDQGEVESATPAPEDSGDGRDDAVDVGAEGAAAIPQETAAGSGSDDLNGAAEEDEADQAARRRRRRGRRGRGRVGDDRQDDVAEFEDAEPDDGSLPVRDSDGQSTGTTTEGEPVDEEAGEEEPDEDGGTRRRRRRRRRVGASDGSVDTVKLEDDPDNTVVHVRAPRSSSKTDGAGSGSSSSEVQGVRGSTRLEAKRQRRRDTRGSRSRPQILTEAEFLARREAVDRVMAVRQRGDLAQVALLEDGILVEHFVSRAGSESLMGNIYLGKVQNVLPSMEAAFVDIGKGRNAVLYAGEVNWDAAGLAGKARRIETALSGGDTILVQVSKDPVGAKGARLTTQISLPGRFLVYVPGSGATGISRKLPDTERRRLKSILDRIVPEDAGVIIRTAAEGVAEEELARDVERLKSQWEEISRQADKKSDAPLLLSAEPDTLIKVVRDLFNSDISRLVLDGERAYEPVAAYIDAVAPELSERVSRYDGQNDVFTAYRIDEQIAKALERKVYLASGGSLVIDRTEAMTVIDVNTGKYTGSGGNLEETVTKNNLEAAEEVVRQLRLRDIGGIIVVDFIDMVLESNRELVMRRLTECLGRDRTRHQVAEVTSLGLIQMTRKKMGTGLVEAFSEPCPHCHGRGIILHDVPMEERLAGFDSDNGSEGDKRSARSRRGRGRLDTTATDPEPLIKVVPATVRPPDPRGPKPPTRSSGDEHVEPDLNVSAADVSEPNSDRMNGSNGRPRRESAATAESSLNAPRSRDASDAVFAVLAALDAQTGQQEAISPEISDSWAGVGESSTGAGATGGRRRGRRAAGRPAGAPTVTIDVLAEPVPEIAITDQLPNPPAQSPLTPDIAAIPDSTIPDSNRAAGSAASEADGGTIEPVPESAPIRTRQPARRRRKAAAVDPAEDGTASAASRAVPSSDTGPDVPAAVDPADLAGVPADSPADDDSAVTVTAAPARRRRAASRPAGPAGASVPQS